MQLKNQLSNQKLSKKLKELGFVQKSEYYWYKVKEKYQPEKPARYEPKIMNNVVKTLNDCNGDEWEYEEIASAYTSSELGEFLPSEYPMAKMLIYLKEHKLI